ncbi:MAG TPA: glycoside hydrolase family 3 N-terminal domain-containing protein [Pyrinomonadaceae bacterium]|nr:glycoside hydrolase family 3 N-terminal domain-containing protein [Pyrinomonadaceae bacterium]
MRLKHVALAALISAQTFCLPLQQSPALAQTRGRGQRTTQGRRAQPAPTPPQVSVAAEDSDAFLQGATRRRPARDYTREVEALLRRMTLEEKVGQMTQLEIGMVTTGSDQNIRIDPAKLDKAVVKYGVGSVLNVAGQALTAAHWHEIIGQIQRTAARTRLKIPVLYGIDSIHGANYIQGSTLHPQEIGMAATWNPELMRRLSEVTAMETRAAGIPWTFSPVLDLGRQPLWPRFYETFGEDPYLTKVMGAAFVRGVEGDDLTSDAHVATSLKHYMGYSFPMSGRDRTSAWIPENYLREYFLPSFAEAVRAGARPVVVNAAEINGTPGHVNRRVLTDILRGELGFKGFVVSDWEDIKKLVTQWRVAADEREATRMAVMAGIDMSMVPSDYSFADILVRLVREGAVPQARIDEAVRRILLVKYELGLFDGAMPDASLIPRIGTPESRQLALQAARESMTLLKNDGGVLPLEKNRKILVTGPTADSLLALNNGWTYVWQGSDESLYPKDRPTIRRAIETKVGASNVTFVQGTRLVRAAGSPPNSPTLIDEEVDIAAAARAARDADVVVLCLGEGSYAETPGNITDLTLGEPQLRLARAVADAGKPVVLVLVEGRPRVISSIADGARAILMAYNPSNEGGQAVADVLFGDYNPGGKLPFTYPRSTGNIFAYDRKAFEDADTSFGNLATAPQFEFGRGLSYTTFAYGGLRVWSPAMTMSGTMPVSVTVTNTGRRAGHETVILYVRDVAASLAPPGKRVRRFAKIFLEPGQSRTVNFLLRADDLSFIGADNRPVTEPGDFEVMVGGLTSKFMLR